MTANVSDTLLKRSRGIESDLVRIAERYCSQGDARWLFAKAHSLITKDINRTITMPRLYRDPNALLRFNLSFASAFVAAVNVLPSAAWKSAFAQCMTGEVFSSAMAAKDGHASTFSAPFRSVDKAAVLSCAMAMADAHINSDIIHALRTVGCIDKFDYANVLHFVQRAARTTIVELSGTPVGELLDQLKRILLPLERVWRNAAYRGICGVAVPPIEVAFIASVDRAIARAMPR
jgi:hypothetical protein